MLAIYNYNARSRIGGIKLQRENAPIVRQHARADAS